MLLGDEFPLFVCSTHQRIVFIPLKQCVERCVMNGLRGKHTPLSAFESPTNTTYIFHYY